MPPLCGQVNFCIMVEEMQNQTWKVFRGIIIRYGQGRLELLPNTASISVEAVLWSPPPFH